MSARTALDVAFVRARRQELDVSLRDVAVALGLSERGWASLESGLNTDTLTVAQLNVLAELLAVPVADLLTTPGAERSPAPADDPLEQRLGTLLFVAGCSVPIGVLAEALDATTDAVAAAVEALRSRLAPAGLVVSTRQQTVTVVPDRGSLCDPAVRAMLRVGNARSGLPQSPARLLHRLARGEALAKLPTQDDRARLAVLLRGAWVTPGEDAQASRSDVGLHPDVQFSLLLDEGFRCTPAAITARHSLRRKQLPWLQADDNEKETDGQ